MDRREDAPGEFLPADLAAEVRRLLAGSLELSPELSSWLDRDFKENRHQGRQRQQEAAGVTEDGVGPNPQSSLLPPDAPDGQKSKGARWGASQEWMSNAFDLLDAEEAKNLGNARLVCSGWARQAMSTKTSLVISMAKSEEDLVQKLQSISRAITNNQLPSLQTLEIHERIDREIPASIIRPVVNTLISAACGGCQQLRALKLLWHHASHEFIWAIRPLLPRLTCLHLCGIFGNELSLEALEEALASMRSLADLELEFGGRIRKKIPGSLLAALPKSLTRLSILYVAVEGFNFGSLQCSETLTALEIGHCYFEGPMGLSAAVNLKRLSIFPGTSRHHLQQVDFEGILTLSKLEHLGIDSSDKKFPAMEPFVQRLPGCLPLLTSLELKSLSYHTKAVMVALGSLTGLTSLNLKSELGEYVEVPLVPESLRHLATLTALRHLSLPGYEYPDEPFLEDALPILHCLPSLVSLELSHQISEAHISLFPVQLKTLVIDLDEDFGNEIEGRTAALAGLAERCPGLTSIEINEHYMNNFDLEALTKIHEKVLPWLQVKAVPIRTPPPKDWVYSIGGVNRMMAALEESLREAGPYLKLLERREPWNTPKNPCWNIIGSGEPWVATAQRVTSLFKEIAAAGVNK